MSLAVDPAMIPPGILGHGILRSAAGPKATGEWLKNSANLQELVKLLRDEGVCPGTEAVYMAKIKALVRDTFGKEARRRLFEDVTLRRVENERTRYLTLKEIARVRDVADDWWMPISLSIATGLRQSETLRVRVQDIDFEDSGVVVPESKTPAGKRRIPLGGAPLDLVAEFIEEEELDERDLLFTFSANSVSKAWQNIRTLAGLDHEDPKQQVRWHDLRHTYAVHCARAGMPMVELKQRMGHSDLKTTMRYSKYAPNDRQAYERALEGMGLESESTLSSDQQSNREGGE